MNEDILSEEEWKYASIQAKKEIRSLLSDKINEYENNRLTWIKVISADDVDIEWSKKNQTIDLHY